MAKHRGFFDGFCDFVVYYHEISTFNIHKKWDNLKNRRS